MPRADDDGPLMGEDLLLCLDALATIVSESNEPETIRVALAALLNVPGGAEQLAGKGIAL